VFRQGSSLIQENNIVSVLHWAKGDWSVAPAHRKLCQCHIIIHQRKKNSRRPLLLSRNHNVLIQKLTLCSIKSSANNRITSNSILSDHFWGILSPGRSDNCCDTCSHHVPNLCCLSSLSFVLCPPPITVPHEPICQQEILQSIQGYHWC